MQDEAPGAAIPDDEIRAFIGASFRSVWTLELLCWLRQADGGGFTPQQLVSSLRASALVVRQAVSELSAAGLVGVEANGAVRYAPASPHLDRLAAAAHALYAKAPDAVRRSIVHAANPGLTAFANAFRLRSDR